VRRLDGRADEPRLHVPADGCGLPASCERARTCMLHAWMDAVGMRGRVRVRACMLALSLRVRSGDDVCADRCAPHSRRRTVVPPCQPIPLERRACATRARAVSRLVGRGTSNDRLCLAAACRYASTDTRRLCRTQRLSSCACAAPTRSPTQQPTRAATAAPTTPGMAGTRASWRRFVVLARRPSRLPRRRRPDEA
jgi:hypothetical protein